MSPNSFKILISGRFDPAVLHALSQEHTVTFRDLSPQQTSLNTGVLESALLDNQVLITEGDQVTAALLESHPDLALIISTRGNPVNIDIPAATRQQVAVMNTPGRNAVAVAELAIGSMIMIARKVFPAVEVLRSNGWVTMGSTQLFLKFQGMELYQKTVGIVGLGAIGRLVADRLTAFGMRVLAFDPFISAEEAAKHGAELVSLDDLLTNADFVTLHVPVTPQTTGMIGARELGLMKPGAFLINTARTALTDESALYTALKEKTIAGAVLDVFTTEPLPADADILQLDNVLAIPHLGGATHEVVTHQSVLAVEALNDFVAGKVEKVLNRAIAQEARTRLLAGLS